MKWFLLISGVLLVFYAQNISSNMDSGYLRSMNFCDTAITDYDAKIKCHEDVTEGRDQQETIRLVAYVLGGLFLLGFVVKSLSRS